MPDLTFAQSLISVGAAVLTFATAVLTWRTQARVRRQRAEETSTDGSVVLTTIDPPQQRGPIGQQLPPLLPVRPRFINHKREMDALLARVHAGEDSVLTIEGNRWVGKSAAATELVHKLVSSPPTPAFDPQERHFIWLDAHDGCPSLSDICQHVSLRTGDQALSAIAHARKRDTLRMHLARHKTVLVLDNLSLSDDARSRTLVDFLGDVPDGALVIASVNRPGPLVAARVPLEDLDADGVHELIRDRADRLQLDGVEQFDRAFAERLHGLVGGNPGVIEWFLRGYRDSSESLEERIAAVEKGELSDLFEPTWKVLPPDAICALEALAHLRGEATERQLAIACDRPTEEMRAAAEALRREGLLKPVRAKDRPTVYTCARAFQLFVAGRTADSSRASFTTRLADHYIAHFAANPEDAQYGASEVGALRVVREELFDAGDDARVQTLFRRVLDILFTLGQYDELIAAAELSFESARRFDNHTDATLAAAMKGGTHAIRGELEAAADAVAHAGLAAERSRDPGSIACAMRIRGFHAYRSGRPVEALAAIDGVERIAREANELVVLVDTLDLRTAANWHLGRFDACEEAARASLAVSQEMGWERARAYPLRYLAELAAQGRRWDDAHALLDDAHGVATRLGDSRQRARVDLTRARVCLFEGALDHAAEAAERALAETRRLGLPPEQEESQAVADAIARARRSPLWRRRYARRRPTRMTAAPVGGD